MQIEAYLDDADRPFRTISPPETFKLDTESLPDGAHELRLVAVDDDGTRSERRVRFFVRNGPAIAIHGIEQDDVVSGEISILANAYGSRIGDAFEPQRIESPVPIPTWAWVLVLCIFAWGAGYVALELHERDSLPLVARVTGAVNEPSPTAAAADWTALGAQVYGNNCSSCHQLNGTGLAGVFPGLVGNVAVIDTDPTDHIVAILQGLSGKVIDGVSYPGPMPPFGAALSDEEVAAVVNHERRQWGNEAPLVSPEQVAALR